MPVDDFVGAALRMRRKELGLTQTDLARGLGITLQQVQKYETGMNRITAGRLAAAAELLQSPISYFFEGPRKSKRDASEELALLKATGAKDLLRSYAEIRSPQDRKALLHIAKSLRHRRSEDSRA